MWACLSSDCYEAEGLFVHNVHVVTMVGLSSRGPRPTGRSVSSLDCHLYYESIDWFTTPLAPGFSHRPGRRWRSVLFCLHDRGAGQAQPGHPTADEFGGRPRSLQKPGQRRRKRGWNHCRSAACPPKNVDSEPPPASSKGRAPASPALRCSWAPLGPRSDGHESPHASGRAS